MYVKTFLILIINIIIQQPKFNFNLEMKSGTGEAANSRARCECAGVSPPGNSLINGCEASQGQGLIGSFGGLSNKSMRLQEILISSNT